MQRKFKRNRRRWLAQFSIGALLMQMLLTIPVGEVLASGGNLQQIAGGRGHSLALTPAGEVVAWGSDGSGRSTVPEEAKSEIVSVGAGQVHSLALTSSGEVIAWGSNGFGQSTVPDEAKRDIVAIAAGPSAFHSLALTDSGKVIAWGDDDKGQAAVPADAQSDVVEISAGAHHSLALTGNGKVIAWGDNKQGQTNVPASAESNVVAISAGGYQSLALKTDGSVIAWGNPRDDYEQVNVPVETQSGVIAIAVGYEHSLALKSDGSIVAWGRNSSGEATVPGSGFADGDGTEGSPYIIKTADQLNAVRDNLGAHYKLGADIDLSGYSTGEGWVPIGNSSNRFTGSFNGANYTITGLTINREGHDQGLFGFVGTNGIIQNTKLEGVRIDATSGSLWIGGLAGSNNGSIKDSSVKGIAIKGYQGVGGLVGESNGIITNSFATIDVTGVDWFTTSPSAHIGGLVGVSFISSGISSKIHNSYATGKVLGNAAIGGLVGSSSTETGEITNSYASGEVTGTRLVGGLVGRSITLNGGTTEITNSYATGEVTGTRSVGGLVGSSSTFDGGTAEITNSYWDKETTGLDNSDGGGEGKSSEEMQQRNTFKNWDFYNIWYQYEGQTTPFLQWQNPVTALDVSITKDTLQVNETTEITVKAKHEDGQLYDGKDHATYSANPAIVSIEKGIVTAEKSGETVIMIDLFGVQKSVNVKVLDVPVIAPDAPILSAAPKFVNTETVQLTGKAQVESTIQITGGSKSISRTANPTGIFEIDVPLNKNTENKLEVTATVDGLESEATKLSIIHDDVKPIITLKGESIHTIYQGTKFTVPGATATDPIDGEMSAQIIVSGDTVDTSKLGDYTIHYNVMDQARNKADQVSRTVKVVPIPSSGGGSGSGWIPSSNADLEKLEVLMDGKNIMLTPTFSSNQTTYIIETEAQKIRLIAKTAHSSGKVSLNGKSLEKGLDIDLKEGANVFELIIEAENGTKKTYALTIHRKMIEPAKPVEPTKPIEPIVPAIVFTDITGHWAESYIQQAAEANIIKGYPDGTFKPNNPLTRTQVVSLLVRALGLQTDEVAPFKDIGNYAAETQDEINAAYKYGLVKGQNDNFMPANKVTRAQIALMSERAYEYKTGTKYTVSKKAPYIDFGNYDAETVNAISMLHELDIATGSDGKFNPGNPTTRAHAAKILMNFMGKLK